MPSRRSAGSAIARRVRRTGVRQRLRATAPASSLPERAHILGCHVDRLDMPQTVRRIDALIQSRSYTQHVAINAAKIVAMRDDPELRRIIESCPLASADGQSIVWAARLLGDPLPCRVAGIDLMQELLGLSEGRGYRVYFLGARANVLAEALEQIRERHPGLHIAGARDGYFREEDSAAVAAEIAATRPDILFVGMSSPRKEYWLGRHGADVGAPFVMGVGGSIDVLAGMVRRAPRLMQRAGLEWLWRVAQEPRRLVGRYVVTNARFLALLADEMRRRRIQRSAGPGAR